MDDTESVDLDAARVWLQSSRGRAANADDLARHLGVDRAEFDAHTLRHFHVTPTDWLESRRIDWARASLEQHEATIEQAAHVAGFDSIEAFAGAFRRRMFVSPGDYVRLAGTDRFEVDLPSWLNPGPLLGYLGRDPKSASEGVAGQRFRIALTVEGAPVGLTVLLGDHAASAEISAGTASRAALPPGTAFAVHGVLLRLLGVHLDPRLFEEQVASDPALHLLVDGRRGLAISQTRDLFDALLWVVAGQQVSLPVAFALRRRLTRQVGVRLDDRLFAPPTPEAVAVMETGDLRRLGFSVRKAEYIQGIARAAVGGELDLRLTDRSAVEVATTLTRVRGLGPWSVAYLLMRAFSFADCVPVGDAALVRKLRRFYQLDHRPDVAETLSLMAPFAPYRSLATFYLWAMPEG